MSDDEDNHLDLPDTLPYEDPTSLLEHASSATAAPKSKRSKSVSSSSSRTRPVVKLVVTSVTRSYSEPWRRRTQRESNGTGFLVRWTENTGVNTNGDGDASGASNGEGSRSTVRIITNAHVVRNASSVRARSSFGPHVVNCSVEWVSLPLDLALVKIVEADYEDFCRGWGFTEDTSVDQGHGGAKKGLACLTLEKALPSLDSNVTCVGFPMGGKQISVTRGVISRIDVDTLNVLRIQIDAAINPGNSGGVSRYIVWHCCFNCYWGWVIVIVEMRLSATCLKFLLLY